MVYLIANLAGWLLLTAAFAGLAGWAFAAQRAAPEEARARRERENLIRDLVAHALGDGLKPAGPENERAIDVARRMAELNNARIAQLEDALDAARAHADEMTARAAELERALAERDEAPRQAMEVAAEPAPEAAQADNAALLNWRLRYFEQRVRYLEENGAAAAPAPAPARAPEPEPEREPAPQQPLEAWRARVKAAEAAHLAAELRALAQHERPAAAEAPTSPFAADADVDMLLRWRMLYLERRVAHLQSQLDAGELSAPLHPAAAADDAESERWKWRARYLEARLRHLEQRSSEAGAAPAAALAPAVEPEPDAAAAQPAAAAPPESAPARLMPLRGAKPPILAAPRNGAPDDLTLIEGVDQRLQSTLYSLGVFHFDQIAAWTPEHAAWVDTYLRLRGRIEAEEWVEQARELAREPASA